MVLRFFFCFLQNMQKWAYSLYLSSLRLRCRLAFRAVTVSVMILFHPRYHRLTRANTPASVSFRRFLPFSPWRAPARLRLKSQKSLEDPSLAGAGSFAGAEMCPDKERPAENTAVLSRGLTRYGRISARQNRACPCQSMVQSATRSESQLFRTGRALHISMHSASAGSQSRVFIICTSGFVPRSAMPVSIWLICAAPTSVIAASRSCVRFFR